MPDPLLPDADAATAERIADALSQGGELVSVEVASRRGLLRSHRILSRAALVDLIRRVLAGE